MRAYEVGLRSIAMRQRGASEKTTGFTKSSAIASIPKDLGCKTSSNKSSFRLGTTVDDVVDRMIAILQEAARQ
jgi:hypothetical protein